MIGFLCPKLFALSFCIIRPRRKSSQIAFNTFFNFWENASSWLIKLLLSALTNICTFFFGDQVLSWLVCDKLALCGSNTLVSSLKLSLLLNYFALIFLQILGRNFLRVYLFRFDLKLSRSDLPDCSRCCKFFDHLTFKALDLFLILAFNSFCKSSFTAKSLLQVSEWYKVVLTTWARCYWANCTKRTWLVWYSVKDLITGSSNLRQNTLCGLHVT